MNPRHRRLLIPGLLVALLVIVVITSLVNRAEADEPSPRATQVSTIDDPRITEASGLAVSVKHDDLAYVINDSGNSQQVFAVQVSTGRVVGTTTVSGGPWVDTEALAIDADGRLWVSDTGDNAVRRTDAALYVFDEPGPGDHSADADRYPVEYEDGPQDAEALLVEPSNGRAYLVSKGLGFGDVYALPADLRTDRNVAERVGSRIGGIVTDGSFTPDGRRVLLRTYGDVNEVEPDGWTSLQRLAVPEVRQGETLAVERDGRSFLIGSEGAGSPLIRVSLPGAPTPTATPSRSPGPLPTAGTAAEQPAYGSPWRTWALTGVGIAALVGLGAWVARR